MHNAALLVAGELNLINFRQVPPIELVIEHNKVGKGDLIAY